MKSFKKNIPQTPLAIAIALSICVMYACVQYAAPDTQSVLFPDAFYVGSEECAVCHEDVFEYFSKTVHYKIRSFEVAGRQTGCESCHGPGSDHVTERGKVEKILSFSKLTPQESSAICLKCHTQEPLLHWSSNLHASANVGCIDCHKQHKITARKLLFKEDPDLCYDCHRQIRAKAEFPSHHPIREGRMKCAECHDPHGAELNSLKAGMVNDLCYDCHAEKQGPFIYDHPPVEEGCSLCHDAHGSIANNLLKQSEPFLCMRCHRAHRRNPLSSGHPSMSTLLTSCTQCHSEIHGSDLPSQMGRGNMTR